MFCDVPLGSRESQFSGLTDRLVSECWMVQRGWGFPGNPPTNDERLCTDSADLCTASCFEHSWPSRPEAEALNYFCPFLLGFNPCNLHVKHTARPGTIQQINCSGQNMIQCLPGTEKQEAVLDISRVTSARNHPTNQLQRAEHDTVPPRNGEKRSRARHCVCHFILCQVLSHK